jgi:hypothetical protein
MRAVVLMLAGLALCGLAARAGAEPTVRARQVAAVTDPDEQADLDVAVESQARTSEPEHRVELFAAVVGGVHLETLQLRASDDAEGRSTTLALSRFGLRGKLGGGVYVESEFEVNSGPHGTSVWEGQAALQVRNQLVRLERDRLRVEVGRITDDSSLDFFSHHQADQLLTDAYTRSPLLASGFNRGQGVLARFEVAPGIEPGITINAANPTSTTASLVIGGTFPPFSRFYFAPHQQVGRDASGFPSDTYQIVLVTPSVVQRGDRVDSQASAQLFRVNTDTSSTEDENIIGYNLRAGARLKLARGKVAPFINGSRVVNSVVDPNDGHMLSDEAFVGYTLSTGIDYNLLGASGVGFGYAFIRGTQGSESRTTEHYANLGGTYWLTPTTSLGARLSLYRVCSESPDEPCEAEGARSMFMTMRTLL